MAKKPFKIPCEVTKRKNSIIVPDDTKYMKKAPYFNGQGIQNRLATTGEQ